MDNKRMSQLRFIERASRLPCSITLDVKTFGSSAITELESINVSKTGILVCAFADTLPFQKNTILEITIDPKANVLSKSIDCLAKVARIEHIAFNASDTNENHEILKLGIHITEINQQNYILWENFIQDLENKSVNEREFSHEELIAKCISSKPKNK